MSPTTGETSTCTRVASAPGCSISIEREIVTALATGIRSLGKECSSGWLIGSRNRSAGLFHVFPMIASAAMPGQLLHRVVPMRDRAFASR